MTVEAYPGGREVGRAPGVGRDISEIGFRADLTSIRPTDTLTSPNPGAPGLVSPILAADIGAGAVTAEKILAAAVDATKLNTKQVILLTDTWTDNSPVAGSVAWNAHSLVYNGTVYSIVSGNTANKYIVWRPGVSTTVYQTYTQAGFDALVLADNDFVIVVNNSGSHDIAWYARLARQFIASVFIADAAILTAKIADLAVTDAKIANLAAAKILAGIIQVVLGVGATGTPSITLDGARQLIVTTDSSGVERIKTGRIGP